MLDSSLPMLSDVSLLQSSHSYLFRMCMETVSPCTGLSQEESGLKYLENVRISILQAFYQIIIIIKFDYYKSTVIYSRLLEAKCIFIYLKFLGALDFRNFRV